MASRQPSKWYYETEHDGKTYEIRLNSDPIKVIEYSDRNDGGRSWYETDRQTQAEVIMAAGWKLSRSKRWKDAWEYAAQVTGYRRKRRQGHVVS